MAHGSHLLPQHGCECEDAHAASEPLAHEPKEVVLRQLGSHLDSAHHKEDWRTKGGGVRGREGGTGS